MKKVSTLTFIITLMISTLFSKSAIAENQDTYNVPMQKVESYKIDRDGRRSIAHPIICVINRDGTVSGIQPEEINTYEIWDNTGEICIMSSSSPKEFTDFIFTYPDNYQIRITADDFYLIGRL
ncbi:hypothetical protein [Lepagella muris]|jgi:hypothetical protein|uniref:Uncharacterized protein n=1 Tax=Lepagella muris TaxID=3032870 RepID=A0AC61RKI9_9BACT|nr:hypothetical protein [Lepagella muris]TGY77794.1 hypothetical protein E5331_13235 [Lepagella muris]THG50744.1 hypothetical protein E5984_12740 [Bacteroidales bacterium]TKC56141.1 hypothetical protein E5359_013970 [Bacteroidales bacterium]